MIRNTFLGLLVALYLIPAINTQADVTLPAIFSDHMVLQQGTTVPVWGWAAPGESVSAGLLQSAAPHKRLRNAPKSAAKGSAAVHFLTTDSSRARRIELRALPSLCAERAAASCCDNRRTQISGVGPDRCFHRVRSILHTHDLE